MKITDQNKKTLLELLSDIKDDEILIKTEDNLLTKNDIYRRSISLRDNLIQLKGKNVALKGKDNVSFICSLIALDGFANKLFILPDQINKEVFNESNINYQVFCEKNIKYEHISNNFENNLISDQTVWILTTSGTTGTPKLIEHSIDSLLRSRKQKSNDGKRYSWGLVYTPSRFAGLQVIFQSLFGGGTLVMTNAAQSFDQMINVFLTRDVNAMSATPTMWRKMVMDERIFNLDLLQITLGGEIVDQTILDILLRKFPNARMVHIYASTEAGFGFSVKDCKAGFPKKWLDNESSPVPLKIGSEGNLYIKPPISAKGEEIKERIEQTGYLDTGDNVFVQDDRVYFSGRSNGAINVGGNKVNPEFIEQKILTIKGIEFAKVYGKKNSFMGEVVAIDIIISTDIDPNNIKKQIRDYSKDNFPKWSRPALINIVKKFNINSNGKLNRQ